MLQDVEGLKLCYSTWAIGDLSVAPGSVGISKGRDTLRWKKNETYIPQGRKHGIDHISSYPNGSSPYPLVPSSVGALVNLGRYDHAR